VAEKSAVFFATVESGRLWVNEAQEGLKKGSSNQHNSRKSRKQHRMEKTVRIEK
jgi:hypothetical protein